MLARTLTSESAASSGRTSPFPFRPDALVRIVERSRASFFPLRVVPFWERREVITNMPAKKKAKKKKK